MDGNLQPLRSRIPLDQIETKLDTSVITGANSIDLVQEDEAIPSDNKMAKPLSTEWTDEKHRLYLSSMEASFVKQLFNHEYRSMNMFDRSSRGRSKPDPNSLNKRGPSSGQFKVLQSGHWKQLNFDKPQPRLDVVVDESPTLPENHWIKHYKPERRHRKVVTSLKVEENGSPCNEAVHSHLYRQESVGSSTTEVSDQNFPIEDHKGEPLSSFSRAKRMKTTRVDDSTGVDDSNKDQVVPTGESPVMPVPPV